MQDRSISTKVLLTETFRLFPQFLLLVAFVAVAHVVVYLSLGSSELLAVVFALFFALLYFSAPLASSAVRTKRELRLFTRAAVKTLLFCFAWGSVVIALFIATLQLWQGMDATALNYIVSMVVAGLICAVTAIIPTGR